MIRRRKPLPQNSPIKRIGWPRRVSKKQAGKLRIYSAKRKAFLETHLQCEIGRHCCTGRSTDVHHVHGRGPFLNDEKTWVAACRCCHDWVHQNPGLARVLGFLS